MVEASAKASGSDGSPLEAFLEAIQSYLKNVTAAMVKAAGNDPDGALIEGTSRMAVSQFGKVAEEVRRLYGEVNVGARREADTLLRIQDGVQLAGIGQQIAAAALAKGVGGGFFAWITEHLRDLKKIIRMIIEALTGGVPRWLDAILELIDELWNLISSLLGGVLGFRRAEIAEEVSAGEVHFLNEMAALERLNAAKRPQGSDED